jgi:hypothetical protein
MLTLIDPASNNRRDRSTLKQVVRMSAFGGKADISLTLPNVCF